MARPTIYPWHLLQIQGDWLIIPDKIAAEISSSAKSYMSRRFGPSIVLSISTIPEGVFVALAHVPELFRVHESQIFKEKEQEEVDPDEDIAKYLVGGDEADEF
jgi:hypothetical protein